jgi:hypothetical protein
MSQAPSRADIGAALPPALMSTIAAMIEFRL